MQEVMDHRPNCFELFGLDFVVDQNLECWLIEANISPDFSVRQGQEWLTGLVVDMADADDEIVVQKVVKTQARQ